MKYHKMMIIGKIQFIFDIDFSHGFSMDFSIFKRRSIMDLYPSLKKELAKSKKLEKQIKN